MNLISSSNQWSNGARCASLTPSESDALFFPGSGGKSTKAQTFCSQCPVKSLCLQQAIELRLEGFYAGTTFDERNNMAAMFGITQKPLVDIVKSLLPVGPGIKIRKRTTTRYYSDTYSFLNDLIGPE